MPTYPKWATPERRAWLAYQLALRMTPTLEGWETDILTGELRNPEYERIQDMLRHEWAAEDREQRAYLCKLEQRRLHPREYIRQGGFDSIMREVYLEHQPSHWPEGTAIDVLRQQPVAKVRVASSPVRLWVDIPPSKNALRKARRYGKGRLAAIEAAVADYRNS